MPQGEVSKLRGRTPALGQIEERGSAHTPPTHTHTSIRHHFLKEVGLELGLKKRHRLIGLPHSSAANFEGFGWKKDIESLEKGRTDGRQ